MNKRLFVTAASLLALWLSLLPQTAKALILVGQGNQPVHDAGWPEGSLAVANLPSRVGWWEGPPFGGGEWHFLYQGDTDAFAQALNSFAAIRSQKLELFIHEGPENSQFLKDNTSTNSGSRVDWTFTVWVPANWHHLYNNPKSHFGANQSGFREPVAAPRMDVYVGGGGKVDLARINIPKHVIQIDERATLHGFTNGSVLRMDVYDMTTGKPVRGARIQLERHGDTNKTILAKECDESGIAQIESIPSGTYRIVAKGDGYATRTIGYESFRTNTYKKIPLELAKAASIRGMVTDSLGRELPGAKVWINSTMGINGRGYGSGENREMVTDMLGLFVLDDLPTGFIQLGVHAQGYHQENMFALYEVPTTNVVIRLAGAGILHIQVMDKNQKPISIFEGNEIHVHVEPKGGSRVGLWSASGKVDTNGIAHYTEVPVGEYTVTSRPNPSTTTVEYADTQTVAVKAGMTNFVTVTYR